MPNRILRPWVDSEAVNSLSDAAEIFFIRLIMCADDCGRFYGSPQLLKSYLFPLKDKRVADISRWIAECVKAGLIADYEVSGKRYIVIPKFGQRLRILKSKFPPPPDDSQMTDTCQTDDSQMTDKWQSNDSHEVEDEEETRIRREGENNAPTRMYSQTSSDNYPHTVDEVISIAQSPQCGVKCTKEQAEIYLATRQANNWYNANRNKITVGGVPADIKIWMLREQQKQQNERKEKDYYASGRHIGQGGTFRNDPI